MHPRSATARATATAPVPIGDSGGALPPGPKGSAVLQLLRYSTWPLDVLEANHARFGDAFTLRLAGYGDLVVLSDPRAVKDVFRGDSRVLHSGEGNEFLSILVGKNSVLVLDDAPHARQRRVLVPPLKGERMRAYRESMRRVAAEEIRTWPIGRPMRMVEPMQRITLRVILEAVLGLERGPRFEDIEQRIRRVLALSRSRHSLILVKLVPSAVLERQRWLPFRRRLDELDAALFQYIEERRRLPRAERGDNVLAELLDAKHEDGTPLGNQEIRDDVLTMLVAGHDTTALGLSWALETIAPRGDVVARIVAEVEAAGGIATGDAESDRSGNSLDAVDSLTFLDAAIKESLRVRTVLPFVVRLTKAPFTAGGREYPPGVLLCPCMHLVHRRADLYPDPATFRPERFLERRFGAHEWFPFGGGDRTCAGMAFALYEMKAVLAEVFRSVTLARPEGARSVAVRRGIALSPDDGARMIVTSRTGDRS